MITDDKELFSFNAVAETKKMEYLIEIYNWFQTHKKWKELCGFFSRHDEKDCASYMRMHQCVELNRHTPGTAFYKQQVAFKKTLLGAEYNALRCPEQWFREILENGKPGKAKMFPNGILNKKLSSNELLMMARQMNDVVRRQCPHIRKNYNYSAPGIADMLNCIYKCRYIRSGNHIVITALELWKNVSANVSGEKLTDENVIRICDRAIAECRYLSGSERKRTFEQITKSLKKVLDSTVMGWVEQHLREWIGIYEDATGGAIVTLTNYQEGTLQAVVEGQDLMKAS